jgi:hypothetical protein
MQRAICHAIRMDIDVAATPEETLLDLMDRSRSRLMGRGI